MRSFEHLSLHNFVKCCFVSTILRRNFMFRQRHVVADVLNMIEKDSDTFAQEMCLPCAGLPVIIAICQWF